LFVDKLGVKGHATSRLALIAAQPPYCRAVRTFAGRGPGWLLRQGLMSRPPRRV
jgi:hypothetical protein